MIVFMQKASEVGRKMNGLFVHRNILRQHVRIYVLRDTNHRRNVSTVGGHVIRSF